MLSGHCLASPDDISYPWGVTPGCLRSSMRGGRERPATLIVARPIGYSRLQQVSTELLKGVPHYIRWHHPLASLVFRRCQLNYLSASPITCPQKINFS
jgi:hypothetical protein